MELPPYRWPMWKSLSLRLMDRAKAFLFRAGTVILGVSILLWALTYLPMHNGQPPQIADSAISKIGHFIEPAIRPLGFNWKIGVGLLSSFAAREVIIATMGTLHGVDPESHAMALQEALKSDLSPAGAIALLVFFAFAMQCMSTMAVVQRETNSWKWPILQFLYMTTVAYSSTGYEKKLHCITCPKLSCKQKNRTPVLFDFYATEFFPAADLLNTRRTIGRLAFRFSSIEALPYWSIVVETWAWRISFCCTPTGAPVSSSQAR